MTVEFHSHLPVLLRIQEIKPILDPRAQAGLHTLTLEAEMILPAMQGMPIEPLTLVLIPALSPVQGEKLNAAAGNGHGDSPAGATTGETAAVDTPAADSEVSPSAVPPEPAGKRLSIVYPDSKDRSDHE